MIATQNHRILLAFAETCFEYGVSTGSTYAEDTVQFEGLSGTCETDAANFIDPSHAIEGIERFFGGGRLGDVMAVAYRTLPDRAILTFPKWIEAPWWPTQRERIDKTVAVTDELRRNMSEVCRLLDEQPANAEVSLEDDAIQIGALRGGQLGDESPDEFAFDYYDANGEIWSFIIHRTMMDSLADGTLNLLDVTASIPRNAG